MNDHGFAILPYDIISLIGMNHDWNIILNCALTCRAWHEYLEKFPWSKYMPFYQSLIEGKDFNQMNMFCMLFNMQKVFKNIHEESYIPVMLINRIPIVDTGYRLKINRNDELIGSRDFIEEIDINKKTNKEVNQLKLYPDRTKHFSKLREFIKNHWNLNVSNTFALETKSVTLPGTVRDLLLTNTLPFYGITYDGSINIPPRLYYKLDESIFDDNFIQTHAVIPYSGVLDFYQIKNILYLITNDMMSVIDIINRVENARVKLNKEGVKFFGFYKKSIVPMVLSSNLELHCLTSNGWIELDPHKLTMKESLQYNSYVYYDDDKVNVNKLDFTKIYGPDGTTRIDITRWVRTNINFIGLNEDHDENLLDKLGQMPDFNPWL